MPSFPVLTSTAPPLADLLKMPAMYMAVCVPWVPIRIVFDPAHPEGADIHFLQELWTTATIRPE
jgi:hypothetical protein